MGASPSDPIAKQIKSSRPWGAPTGVCKPLHFRYRGNMQQKA